MTTIVDITKLRFTITLRRRPNGMYMVSYKESRRLAEQSLCIGGLKPTKDYYYSFVDDLMQSGLWKVIGISDSLHYTYAIVEWQGKINDFIS